MARPRWWSRSSTPGYTNHDDLAGRTLPGYDFIADPLKAATMATVAIRIRRIPATGSARPTRRIPSFRRANAMVEDSSWHGTSVAGIAVANTDNGQWRRRHGLVGEDCCRFACSESAAATTRTSWTASTWAAGLPVPGVPANPNPAQVINLSLGGPRLPCSPLYHAVFQQALAHGVTRAIVVAAGNESVDVATTSRPELLRRGDRGGGDHHKAARWRATAISAPASPCPRRAAATSTSRATRSSTLFNDGATIPARTRYTTLYSGDERFSADGRGRRLADAERRAESHVGTDSFAAAARARSHFRRDRTATRAMCGAGIVDARAAVPRRRRWPARAASSTRDCGGAPAV